MKKEFYRLISAVLITSMAASMVVSAEKVTTSSKSDVSTAQTLSVADDYDKYVSAAGFEVATENDEVAVSAETFDSEIGSGVEVKSEYEGEQGVILWSSEAGEITYRVNVPKSALYCLDLTYLPLPGNGSDIEVGLKIDGSYPFEAAEDLILNRMWINASKPHTDDIGNEYSSEQVEYGKFVTRRLADNKGIHTTPYEFPLSAGEHTITLSALSQGFALSEIKLAAPERTVSYKDYISDYDKKDNYKGKAITIDAEDAFLKSTRSLVAKADNSSADITPSSASISRLNYIGGSNWQGPGEELNWNFSVKESGWYKMGFSFKQDGVINGSVYRTMKIDGKTPFTEAQLLKFDYDTKWQFQSFTDEEGEDCYIYLEAGDHVLSMAVTLGETAPIYSQLQQTIFDIGQLYLSIIMITGESPDTNRDYDLFKQIPNFNETLEDLKGQLNSMTKAMQDVTGEESNQYIAAFNNTVRVIDEMIENPYTAQVYVQDFYTQYTTLGSWLSEMVKMPLSLDSIQLCAPENEFEDSKAGFFEGMWFSVKRFVLSFSSDYSRLSVVSEGDKQLKIWINWGRDQAMVLNSLIQQSFTPQTGISVNLELTNASLIKGMLSNTQPDLQLHMSRTEPVNLAMRGALYDLKKFDDYDEVITRFIDSGTVPYTYKDGVYALPDTQNFYLMFYRTDIFEQLGLSVPNTWEEFLDTAANIQRNNMTVHLPYTQITSTTTVNTGVGGLNLFASILQQHGGKVYNDELTACTLQEPVALSAFTFWTEMHTKYKVPTTQNFYNRFKVGTCPLGVEVYTQYTQISEAAPEIDGCWDVALVPGIEDENGNINRAVSGSGSGCCILEKSENKEEAWEFLKWWTSAETQLSYNNNVESILGSISRTTTATVEAFEQMSWDKKDLSVLLEQRSNIEEVPEVPGGYYLTRAVDQAFWQVVNGDSNAKDALVYWGETANNEITRKIKQYS